MTDKVWEQNGLIITKGDTTLEVGDKIKYDPNVESYNGEWRVLGAEDGNLLIMSVNDVETLELYGLCGGLQSTETPMTLIEEIYGDYGKYVRDSVGRSRELRVKTRYGLLNGIEKLNEICKPYSKGKGAISSRCVKAEDINRIAKYYPNKFGKGHLERYGNNVTYSWNNDEQGKVYYTSTKKKQGTLYLKHIGGFNYVDFEKKTNITVPINEGTMPTIQSDYYYYSLSGVGKGVKAMDLIRGVYWLASTTTHTTMDCVEYGMRSFVGGRHQSYSLFSSLGFEYYAELGVRAVVVLSSEVMIRKTGKWCFII